MGEEAVEALGEKHRMSPGSALMVKDIQESEQRVIALTAQVK